MLYWKYQIRIEPSRCATALAGRRAATWFNTNLSNYDDFRKYSVEEIGNMLGIGKTKTRELLQSRLLPVTKIGRDYFTSKTAIQDFLNKNVGKELFF